VKTLVPDLGRRTMQITDPKEIEDIEGDGVRDIVGWQDSQGHYFAYSSTVQRYRRRREIEESNG